MTSLTSATALALSVLLLSACGSQAEPVSSGAATVSSVAERVPGQSPTSSATRPRVPELRVTRMVRRLAYPWDVKMLPGGQLLLTERDSHRLLLRRTNGTVQRVAFPSATVWSGGETGLMGLAIDPGFASNRQFYTCQGGYDAGVEGGHDIRVVSWQLDATLTRATMVRELLGGIQTVTGRHGGCRLLIPRSGSLLVGTGDAAVGTNPEDLTSLNGKVLQLDRTTGAPWPANPFIGAANTNQRYVLSYGHRNVQGLAERADSSIWSVEQGTYRDDEVNLNVPGGDYGYNPVPDYNESVPMTDQALPGTQLEARWRSGKSTLATCGGVFVRGKQWGALDGTLAVAALKAERIIFLRFDASGRLLSVRTPPALRATYGRLRSVSRARNGDLLVTTANGSGDAVLRVHPHR